MTPAQIILKSTSNWPIILHKMEEDIMLMQKRNYDQTGQYLTLSRMLFDNLDFSYTNIDEIFTLDYNIDSLDKIMAKVLYNKAASGRTPKALYVCIPSLAQKHDGTQIGGIILFTNLELTSKIMFYAFDGLKLAPMPNIIHNMQMPAMLKEFQFLLPYYITRN